MAWTETQVDMLKGLWAEGLSASQIARQIGGISRNAVIGKIHRLGLAARDKPSRQTKAAKTSRTTGTSPKTSTLASPATTEPGSDSRPIRHTQTTTAKEQNQPLGPPTPEVGTTSVLDIRDSMCKWPIGDPSHPDFAFCGKPKYAASSYCPAHTKIAYQPLRKRDASGTQTHRPATG